MAKKKVTPEKEVEKGPVLEKAVQATLVDKQSYKGEEVKKVNLPYIEKKGLVEATVEVDEEPLTQEGALDCMDTFIEDIDDMVNMISITQRSSQEKVNNRFRGIPSKYVNNDLQEAIQLLSQAKVKIAHGLKVANEKR